MRVGNRAAALAVLVGLLGLTAAPAADRAAGGARKIYTSRVSFSLPVRIDERDRAELRELKFYVKALQGARPGEWICLETAKPTKEKFSYQAALDGEYWFAFVT